MKTIISRKGAKEIKSITIKESKQTHNILATCFYFNSYEKAKKEKKNNGIEKMTANFTIFKLIAALVDAQFFKIK